MSIPTPTPTAEEVNTAWGYGLLVMAIMALLLLIPFTFIAWQTHAKGRSATQPIQAMIVLMGVFGAASFGGLVGIQSAINWDWVPAALTALAYVAGTVGVGVVLGLLYLLAAHCLDARNKRIAARAVIEPAPTDRLRALVGGMHKDDKEWAQQFIAPAWLTGDNLTAADLGDYYNSNQVTVTNMDGNIIYTTSEETV